MQNQGLVTKMYAESFTKKYTIFSADLSTQPNHLGYVGKKPYQVPVVRASDHKRPLGSISCTPVPLKHIACAFTTLYYRVDQNR